MKECPTCGAPAFDDAAVCFGCLYRFDEGKHKLIDSDLAKKIATEASCARSMVDRARKDQAFLEHALAHIDRISEIASDFSITGEDSVRVPCKAGTLVAEFRGDRGIYDGIEVDLVRSDGRKTQCALVETDDAGELHVFSWDGDNEDYVSKQIVNPHGEYWYE